MADFRTIESSDPNFEFEGLRLITAKSKAIKGRIDISVYIPEAARNRQNCPVVILLHGVYGSHWAWMMKGGVHKVLEEMIKTHESEAFILVMPSDGLWGDGSGYTEHHGLNFEQLMAKEIPAAVEQEIVQVGKDSTWYISGLSMGGYGALSLGLKYPDQFKGISAHSPITAFENFKSFVEEDWDESSVKGFESIIDIARKAESIPPIRFDCGREDELFEANKILSEQLRESEIKYDFEILGGGHDWEYWSSAISNSLRFFSEINTL